jgi:hypothetical protein
MPEGDSFAQRKLKSEDVQHMALEWYSNNSKPAAEQFDYKITKTTIVLNDSGFAKIPNGTEAVKLGYDSDGNQIGIAPAAGDKTDFKLARRGRGVQFQISAKKLFERFALSPVTDAVEGNFEEADGVLLASLASTGAPKRRRRTKAEMQALAAAAE